MKNQRQRDPNNLPKVPQLVNTTLKVINRVLQKKKKNTRKTYVKKTGKESFSEKVACKLRHEGLEGAVKHDKSHWKGIPSRRSRRCKALT